MSGFEKWFADQEFYTNMRFIHGDALFTKDGDVYRVLPVQMTHVAWVEKQSEIDQLKVKNTALVHALVNTNAEKTKWAHSYWAQVERTAEYGAMLISSDSELAISCFKKEKEIEKLKAENVRLSGLLKEHKRCFDECSQMASDLIKERDQLTEEFEEDKRFLKEAIQSKDTQIEKHKHIQKSDEMLIASQKKRVDQLKAEKTGLERSVKQILSDSKESMVGYVEMDLYDKGYRVCTEYLIDELEKALRGTND